MLTKSENSEIAVLQNQMSTVQTDITEIKSDIKTIIATIDGNFVTKAEFSEYKKSQVWQKALIAIAFSVMGALITFFFTHIK